MKRFPHAGNENDTTTPSTPPAVRLTLRLPTDLALRLRALARLRGRTSTMLVVETLTRQIDDLPDSDKAAIEEIVRTWRSRESREL